MLVLCAASGCITEPPPPLKHVFTTSQGYDGDFVTAAGDPSLDGPAAADVLCNRAAQHANLAGTWTAWISVGDGSNLYDPYEPPVFPGYPHASYRVAAIDRIVGDGPWFNREANTLSGLSQALMFADRTALVTGGAHDIFYDEFGNLPRGGLGVTTWTGTRNNGQPSSWDCNGWTTTHVDLSSQGRSSATPNLGVAGAIYDELFWFDIGPTWTDDFALGCELYYDSPRCPSSFNAGNPNREAMGWGTIPCTSPARLYCFEN